MLYYSWSNPRLYNTRSAARKITSGICCAVKLAAKVLLSCYNQAENVKISCPVISR